MNDSLSSKLFIIGLSHCHLNFFFFFFYTHMGFFVLQTSGSSESTVKRLEEETEIKIKQLKDSALKVSKEVTDLLIKYITTIKN